MLPSRHTWPRPSPQRRATANEIKVTLASVKGSLKSHSKWWHDNIHNPYILDIIDNGYKLPLISIPGVERLNNNKTARINPVFVTSEIDRLVDAGILIKVSNIPTVVNALTVAENSSGKQRLVLDLRGVNPILHVEKFKFEDLKVASQYFSKQCFMCTFDLKSGYSHIDINEAYQQYLGLEWNGKHYVYSSLPFGCSSAGLVFSKVMRELVKRWRSQSIPIVTYLDDGILIANSASEAATAAKIVKHDLEQAGFILNPEKSNWVPSQQLQWLGFKLDSVKNIFEIPDDKLFRTRTFIFKTLVNSESCSSRSLAKFIGKSYIIIPHQ